MDPNETNGSAADAKGKGGKATGDIQVFVTKSPVDHDRKAHAIGAKIKLNREAYDQLKTAGVIEGDWKD